MRFFTKKEKKNSFFSTSTHSPSLTPLFFPQRNNNNNNNDDDKKNRYLDENLQAGLAPDDVPGVFEQRLRWATGALQILARANPLSRRGLGLVQRLLYFDASAYALQSPTTLVLILVPLIFLFTGVTPFAVRDMWELLVGFGLFYVAQRTALWIAHLRIEGGTAGVGVAGTEMLRTTQIGYWLAPGNVRALLTVFWHELRRRALAPCRGGGETEALAFKVTKKKGAGGGGGGSASAGGGGGGGGSSAAASSAATAAAGPDDAAVVTVLGKTPAEGGGPPGAPSAAKVVDFSSGGDHAALRAAFSSDEPSSAAPLGSNNSSAPPKPAGGAGAERGGAVAASENGNGDAAQQQPKQQPSPTQPQPQPQPPPSTRTFDRLKAVLASASEASARVATGAGEALPYLWVHWLYFAAVAAAVVYSVVLAASGKLDDWE